MDKENLEYIQIIHASYFSSVLRIVCSFFYFCDIFQIQNIQIDFDIFQRIFPAPHTADKYHLFCHFCLLIKIIHNSLMKLKWYLCDSNSIAQAAVLHTTLWP